MELQLINYCNASREIMHSEPAKLQASHSNLLGKGNHWLSARFSRSNAGREISVNKP